MTQQSPRRHSVDEIVTAVLTASRVLVAISAASLAEVEDTVTLTQFRSLVVLEGRREVNLTELAGSLAVNVSTAMRTIDRLEALGLVTRRANPANRREVVLAPTSDGTALVHTVTERRRRELAKIVRRMAPERRIELVGVLADLAAAADEPIPTDAASTYGW